MFEPRSHPGNFRIFWISRAERRSDTNFGYSCKVFALFHVTHNSDTSSSLEVARVEDVLVCPLSSVCPTIVHSHHLYLLAAVFLLFDSCWRPNSGFGHPCTVVPVVSDKNVAYRWPKCVPLPTTID